MLISSTERIELKIYISIGGMFALGLGAFSLLNGLYIVSPFLFGLSLLAFLYAYKLCRVEIIGSNLRITRNKRTIETPISNIEKVSYRLFAVHMFTEPHIRIKLKAKTKFGRAIYFSPSNLTEKNEFRFNRKIKSLLENKMEEVQKA